MSANTIRFFITIVISQQIRTQISKEIPETVVDAVGDILHHNVKRSMGCIYGSQGHSALKPENKYFLNLKEIQIQKKYKESTNANRKTSPQAKRHKPSLLSIIFTSLNYFHFFQLF